MAFGLSLDTLRAFGVDRREERWRCPGSIALGILKLTGLWVQLRFATRILPRICAERSSSDFQLTKHHAHNDKHVWYLLRVIRDLPPKLLIVSLHVTALVV